MPKLSQISVDLGKAASGREVDYMGVTLIVASAQNPAFKRARNKAFDKVVSKLRRGKLSNERVAQLQAPAVAEHILVGWRDLQDDDGNAIPYSKEKALELLSDPSLADLYDTVMVASNEVADFMAKGDEDAEGN